MFFITGLPRSRTAWFAEFMTYNGVYCHHELLNNIKNKSDFECIMKSGDNVGNSDCGLFITNHEDMFPEAKTVIIHRDLNDVRDSLKNKGINFPVNLLRNIEILNSAMNGLHVDFLDINKRLEEIYYYCTAKEVDAKRAKKYIDKNIQSEVKGNEKPLLIWS